MHYRSVVAPFIYQSYLISSRCCVCKIYCLFKCNPRPNHTFNHSQHARKEMVEAKEYSHKNTATIALFGKTNKQTWKTMLLALVEVMFHTILSWVSIQRTPWCGSGGSSPLGKHGYPCSALKAFLLSTVLHYHRGDGQWVFFFSSGALLIVIAYFLF